MISVFLIAIASVVALGAEKGPIDVDGGTAYFDKPFTVELDFVNEMPVEQQISVVTDCACVSIVSGSKRTVAPSKSSRLILNYKPQRVIGPLKNKATVIDSKTGETIKTISITTRIVRDFLISPKAVIVDLESADKVLGSCIVSGTYGKPPLKESTLSLTNGLIVEIVTLDASQSKISLVRGELIRDASIQNLIEAMNFVVNDVPTTSINEPVVSIPLLLKQASTPLVKSNQKVYNVLSSNGKAELGVEFSVRAEEESGLSIEGVVLIDDPNSDFPAAQISSFVSSHKAMVRLALGSDSLKGQLRSRQMSFAISLNDGSKETVSVQTILLPIKSSL